MTPTTQAQNLAQSLDGLEALGTSATSRLNRARVYDAAWAKSDGSVVDFSRQTNQTMESALDLLSKGPMRTISQLDPRVLAMTQVRDEGYRQDQPLGTVDDTSKAHAKSEREAMKALDKNPQDKEAFNTLCDVVRREDARSARTKVRDSDAR